MLVEDTGKTKNWWGEVCFQLVVAVFLENVSIERKTWFVEFPLLPVDHFVVVARLQAVGLHTLLTSKSVHAAMAS